MARLTRKRDSQGRLIRPIGVGTFGVPSGAPVIPSGEINTVSGDGLGINPITVVTIDPHGRTTGNVVLIAGTGTAADGTWTITVVDATTFTLDGTESTAAGPASGGTWTLVS